MIAQRVSGIGMNEHVERAMVQRQPVDHFRQSVPLNRQLKGPFWMRSHGPLVKTSKLQRAAETPLDFLAQRHGGVAGSGIEIDMRVPVDNGRYIDKRHGVIQKKLPHAMKFAQGNFTGPAWSVLGLAHLDVGMANSAPFSVLSGQRCMIDFWRV